MELAKCCNMLYFWRGKPTSLGRLSNPNLQEIIRFINKYPGGLLNGYKKQVYLDAVQYILDYRAGKFSRFNEVVTKRKLQKAERFADDLLDLIIKAKLNTEKQVYQINS